MAKSRASKKQPRSASKRSHAGDFTAIIERDGDQYVALCPELDIASQGDTVEAARANLLEAVELFLETAAPSEVRRRLRAEVYVTRLAVARG